MDMVCTMPNNREEVPVQLPEHSNGDAERTGRTANEKIREKGVLLSIS